MGSFSIWHWMIVLLVVMLLFGGGKLSGIMGDFAKGIKTFKKTMAEDDDAPMTPAQIERPAPAQQASVKTAETTAAH